MGLDLDKPALDRSIGRAGERASRLNVAMGTRRLQRSDRSCQPLSLSTTRARHLRAAWRRNCSRHSRASSPECNVALGRGSSVAPARFAHSASAGQNSTREELHFHVSDKITFPTRLKKVSSKRVESKSNWQVRTQTQRKQDEATNQVGIAGACGRSCGRRSDRAGQSIVVRIKWRCKSQEVTSV